MADDLRCSVLCPCRSPGGKGDRVGRTRPARSSGNVLNHMAEAGGRWPRRTTPSGGDTPGGAPPKGRAGPWRGPTQRPGRPRLGPHPNLGRSRSGVFGDVSRATWRVRCVTVEPLPVGIPPRSVRSPHAPPAGPPRQEIVNSNASDGDPSDRLRVFPGSAWFSAGEAPMLRGFFRARSRAVSDAARGATNKSPSAGVKQALARGDVQEVYFVNICN